jgi:hypothetical protein
VEGDEMGEGRWETRGPEKLEQSWMRRLSSETVILSSGSRVKIMPRIWFNSSDKGKMVLRKLGLLTKALYVESSIEACFQGLRPHVRLTRITPRDQMSLGAQRYDWLLED